MSSIQGHEKRYSMMYTKLDETPRLYQNKYFGNADGLSLETVTHPENRYFKYGYHQKIVDAKQVREDFYADSKTGCYIDKYNVDKKCAYTKTAHLVKEPYKNYSTDEHKMSRKAAYKKRGDEKRFQEMEMLDPSMSDREIGKRQYYKFTTRLPDPSLEPFKSLESPLKNQIVEDNTQRLQRKLSQVAPTWPHKYYKNKKGLSLETVRENYNNYNTRPYRDGYKKLDKKGPIRSGPYKYYENKPGHSLRTITQDGGRV